MGSQPAISRTQLLPIVLGIFFINFAALTCCFSIFPNLLCEHVPIQAFHMLLLESPSCSKFPQVSWWVRTLPFLTWLSLLSNFYRLCQCANPNPIYCLYKPQHLGYIFIFYYLFPYPNWSKRANELLPFHYHCFCFVHIMPSCLLYTYYAMQEIKLSNPSQIVMKKDLGA